jgi:hypothetical protein
VNAPDTPSKASLALIRPFIQNDLLKNLRVFTHQEGAKESNVIEFGENESENYKLLSKEYDASKGSRKVADRP